MKARRFIKEHSDHIALQKIKRATPVTQEDLDELGAMMLKLGVVDDEELASLGEEGGLAVFLRRLTGLERAAAKEAFSTFAARNDLKADQNEFLGMLIDFLTETGVVEPRLFYESPFTDIDDLGIAGVFSTVQAKEIIGIVARLNQVEAA